MALPHRFLRDSRLPETLGDAPHPEFIVQYHGYKNNYPIGRKTGYAYNPVYETTGDHDIIAVGKFTDTDQMNDQIKELLVDPDINESNTSVVLNTVIETRQFDLDY